LLPRPRRPAAKLAAHPASKERIYRPGNCQGKGTRPPAA
jgi:hypothetical protein